MLGKIVAGVLVVIILLLGGFFAYDRLTRDTSILETNNSEEYSEAYFAGGCFWCVEADFEKVDGVVEAISGFMGGDLENPTYKNHEGHREAVKVVYDEELVDYETLVQFFFRHHDPSDEGGSFCDRGYAYTSAVYVNNDEEEQIVMDIIEEIDEMEVLDSKIVTAVESGKTFWRAEEYHQDYYKKNPVRYAAYRFNCGRDQFLEETWGDALNDFTSYNIPEDHNWVDYVKPSDEELRESLSELEYKVTQKEGTEPPFSEGNLDDVDEAGLFVDKISGEPLYSSKDKFDSGTGWPSFTKPISSEFVVTKPDYKLIIPRTEVRSRYGDNHIGHVFNDGPEPRGERWCMNGAAMDFIPLDEMVERGYEDYLRFVE
jgi:peptide methionine sulfoxide reductase msrA/msrB